MDINKIILISIIAATSALISSSAAAKTTFGTGNSEPLPNLIDIEIYNVTGLSQSQKRTSGQLVASGLNQTFRLNQTKNTSYRYTFTIRNDGNQDWQINQEDNLSHTGVEQQWNLSQAWYETTQTYEGATFSSGKIAWNTSKGGTLTDGSLMTANYVIEINSTDSIDRNQKFLVNDTSQTTGSYDYHKLNFNKLGYIQSSITNPPDQTVLTQNNTFNLNATFKCREGECGVIEATPRYNETGSVDTLISGTGKPFYTVDPTLKTCNLGEGECDLSWEINATGDSETYHKLDSNVSSSYQRIADNNTEDRLVQINTPIIIDVSFDSLDFGLVDPGESDRPATGNSNLAYNITISEDSIPVDNLWMKANSMTNSSNSYSIGPTNLSYNYADKLEGKKYLSNNYKRINSSINAGTILNTFYWLDVPTGIAKASYRGKISIKANSTS